MNRLLGIAVALFVCLAFGTYAQAQATYPYGRPNYGPFYQPPLSPYLNLLRGGNTAANYFLGTIPEVERRTNQRNVQNTLQNLEQRQDTPAETGDDLLSPLPSTGHGTAFGNVGTYFNQGSPRLNTANQPSTQTPQQRRR